MDTFLKTYYLTCKDISLYLGRCALDFLMMGLNYVRYFMSISCKILMDEYGVLDRLINIRSKKVEKM